jgi:hypothetical protein
MTKKEINIVLSAGCVYSVEGLPENWEYTVTDLDIMLDSEKIKLDGMIQINGTVVKDCSGLYHDG